jgi:hypothetical protein
MAPMKQDAFFWQAVQAVIARGAALWGEGLVRYSLLKLSRNLKQIKLLAPESPVLCPKKVAYEVIDNFFFFHDERNTKFCDNFLLKARRTPPQSWSST